MSIALYKVLQIVQEKVNGSTLPARAHQAY